MSRIFLASRNRKKIVEMERLLREYAPDVEVLGIDDVEGYAEPVEDQPTFEGNALLKARAGLAATGRSEERRVGKECYALCRSRWSPYH